MKMNYSAVHLVLLKLIPSNTLILATDSPVFPLPLYNSLLPPDKKSLVSSIGVIYWLWFVHELSVWGTGGEGAGGEGFLTGGEGAGGEGFLTGGEGF
jgi:hypothetical protein